MYARGDNPFVEKGKLRIIGEDANGWVSVLGRRRGSECPKGRVGLDSV